jgi:hypothetical protein
MEVNDNAEVTTAVEPKTGKRVFSEISWPYSDLESAIELPQTILDKAGSSAELEEVAGWMNQSASGGTFRTRVSAAKLFGLIETSQGRAALTKLGRAILDKDGSELSARVQAFFNIELFATMYEQHKGNILPPPAAIERQMEQLGVSPKQKERARQTFIKSATYAGFIDQTTGRFIKPGNASNRAEPDNKNEKIDGNGGGGGRPPIDPIIQGLLARLPNSGAEWPEAERKLWLQLLEGSFKLIYKDRVSGGGDDGR